MTDYGILLTITKRQLVVLIDYQGNTIWSYGLENSPGNSGKQLCVPMYAVIYNNSIFISDTLNSRVIEVDFDYRLLWQYGVASRLGAGENYLWYPIGLSINKGVIYIADSLNNRVIGIECHTKNIIYEYGLPKVISHRFSYPRSVCYFNNKMILANTHNNTILIINNNGEVYKEISFVYIDGIPSNFYWPRAALFTSENELLVADGLNNRVLVIDYPTLCVKKIIASNTDYIVGDPHDLDIDKNGNIIIACANSNCIIQLDKNYNFIKLITGLADPHSAKYSSIGIVITNPDKNEVLIYRKEKTYSITTYISVNNTIKKMHRPRCALYVNNILFVLDTGNNLFLALTYKFGRWYQNDFKLKYPKNSIQGLNYPRYFLFNENNLIISDTENCRILNFTKK